MRYFLILVVFISGYLNAQQVDVLLIGVSHNYSNYPKQDFSAIFNKVKKFKPSAFFGEFLSKEDESLLMDYWCKDSNLSRIKFLQANKYIPTEVLPMKIDSLKKLSRLQPTNYSIKVDLAHAYYLNQDVPNAHYQYWQVYSRFQQHPDNKLEQYVQQLLSPHLDTTGRSMKRLKTSEYALLAFPLMLEMKMDQLYAMDCQEFDLNWVASSIAVYNKLELLKADSISTDKIKLSAFLTKRDKGFQKNATIEKSSAHITEWLNTDEAAAIYASGDFYFSEMYELENFPREEMSSLLHWWKRRNEGMCQNVVTRARAGGFKKVVVIVGANHRKLMQDIFRSMPNVSVQNINEMN